jgi:YesN/AraC family two-component response regulator
MDAGCDDYFLKPIDFDRLQRVLDRMMPPEPRRRQMRLTKLAITITNSDASTGFGTCI